MGYFKELKKEMIDSITQQDIAKELNCSIGAVSHRFCRKQEFTIAEAYRILDMIGQPYSCITKFFPVKDVFKI